MLQLSPHSRPQRWLGILAIVFFGSRANAQATKESGRPQSVTPPTEEEFFLGETLVTATRSQRAALDTPYSAEAVPAEVIGRRAYRTTPQILRDTPGVMVQETSHGQGSPYIRGFTGYRNLLLIDGVRLNNSIFRSGPNQYWNTVDPLSIDRLEVVKGPSSVLYGSDAIGGTVNVLTKNPFTYGEGRQAGGKFYYRYASAEDSHIARLEVGASLDERMGVMLGLGVKDFGDLRGGDRTGKQPNTGYDEWDLDIKFERFLDEDRRLVFAYQNVRQNNVPRTHKTVFAVPFAGTSVGTDLKRDLDQNRELAYLQLYGDKQGSLVDTYRLSLSWHEQEERRLRVRGNGSKQRQGIDVSSFGLSAQFGSDSSMGRLTYGLDYYRDEVDSFKTGQPIQGPVADDASYDLLGVYLQDEVELNERWSMTLGGRFSYAAADANSVLDPLSGNPTQIEEDWSSFVGSARFTYRTKLEGLNLFGGVSQGFRAPNLSDLTRFDSARTNEFEIPSPGLDPERFLSFELGAKSQRGPWSTQGSFFYTDIEDQISLFPTGNTNGAGEAEITKDNIGDGYVLGIEAAFAYAFNPRWSVFGNATFTEGKVETFPTSAQVVDEQYIDRLMPLNAQWGLAWEDPEQGAWAEFVTVFADDADKLSARDEADTSRIPPGGTPDYLLFHLRGGWRFSEGVELNLGLENLTNEDYRVHGSGQNSPGRSLIFGLTLSI